MTGGLNRYEKAPCLICGGATHTRVLALHEARYPGETRTTCTVCHVVETPALRRAQLRLVTSEEKATAYAESRQRRREEMQRARAAAEAARRDARRRQQAVCPQCGKTFTFGRAHGGGRRRVFCATTCRVRAHKARHRSVA